MLLLALRRAVPPATKRTALALAFACALLLYVAKAASTALFEGQVTSTSHLGTLRRTKASAMMIVDFPVLGEP
jgi:hypothetical protein